MRKILLTTFLITVLSSSVMAQVSVMSEEGIKPSQPKPLVLKKNSNNPTHTTGPNKSLNEYDCDSTCMNMQAQNNVNRSYVENQMGTCPAGFVSPSGTSRYITATRTVTQTYNGNVLAGTNYGAWISTNTPCVKKDVEKEMDNCPAGFLSTAGSPFVWRQREITYTSVNGSPSLSYGAWANTNIACTNSFTENQTDTCPTGFISNTGGTSFVSATRVVNQTYVNKNTTNNYGAWGSSANYCSMSETRTESCPLPETKTIQGYVWDTRYLSYQGGYVTTYFLENFTGQYKYSGTGKKETRTNSYQNGQTSYGNWVQSAASTCKPEFTITTKSAGSNIEENCGTSSTGLPMKKQVEMGWVTETKYDITSTQYNNLPIINQLTTNTSYIKTGRESACVTPTVTTTYRQYCSKYADQMVPGYSFCSCGQRDPKTLDCIKWDCIHNCDGSSYGSVYPVMCYVCEAFDYVPVNTYHYSYPPLKP